MLRIKGISQEVWNTDASEYVEMNRAELVRYAGRFTDKNEDLINDVYLSLRNSEISGKFHDCGINTVEQFVKGRIKQFAMNRRYARFSVEKGPKCLIVPACSNQGDEIKKSDYQTAMENASFEINTEHLDDLEEHIAVYKRVALVNPSVIPLRYLVNNVDVLSKKENHKLVMGLREIKDDKFKESIRAILMALKEDQEYVIQKVDEQYLCMTA